MNTDTGVTAIRKRATEILASAAATLSLDDCKNAASTLQALADSEKNLSDAANQAKLLRYEGAKSSATMIVPFLTLLTLAVTIYFQWSQAQMTTRANEDAQWRDVLDNMTKPPGPTTDVVTITALIPFYSSDRYGSQAHEMAFLLAQQLANIQGFETLFNTAFGAPTWDNSHDIVRLARIVSRAEDNTMRVWRDLKSSSGVKQGEPTALPSGPFQSDQFPPPTNGPISPLRMIEHALDQIFMEQTYLTNAIGEMMRTKRPESSDINRDFSRFMFYEGDLSKADFTNLDISKSSFVRVNVADAILKPAKFDESFWNGTKWWQAEAIDGALLNYLIKNAAPYAKADEFYLPEGRNTTPMEIKEYAAEVERLCNGAMIKCETDHLPFGPSK